MARISTYPFDTIVRNDDAWIGTDSLNKSTKQYTAKAVAEYLNINSKISISAQMVFKYWVLDIGNNNVSVTPGFGEFYGPVDGSAFTSITTMQLSIKDTSGQDVIAFMDYIVGNNILISEQNEISIFGHFKIDSYTINNPDDDFYTLNLTNISGNGDLTEFLYYDFAVFSLPTQGVPTFEYEQIVPSTSWEITHNLSKFPSITVIDSGDTVVAGEYVYNSNNKVTLNFSAAFAGKAYLN
jgi:hypothetical protein|tara:strand:+ start:841 stop:1557 length:717 start_codon:yes stop_codon:yes gene_type:complete